MFRRMVTESNPLFSIILPVYNVEEYIEDSINSLLSQTYENFEIIAIDDGSKDKSGQILDVLALRDERIKVIHKGNGGVSSARNLGLDKAIGEWIIFVDGDDALRHDALSILAECIEQCPEADLISYGFYKVNSIKSTLNQSNGQLIIKHFNNKDEVCFNSLNQYMVWAETFKLSKHKELRFLPLRNGEDVLFCNTLAINSNFYISINAPLYFYLQREISARNNEWDIKRCKDYISLHKTILNNLTTTEKKIDFGWMRRWIGGLLYFEPQILNLYNDVQREYFGHHRQLLKVIKKKLKLPLYLKLWISFSTIINSLTWFQYTAMKPMSIFSGRNKNNIK